MTLENLIDWVFDVGAKKRAGEEVSELEYQAAMSVLKYILAEAYKKSPLQTYALLVEKQLKG